MRFGGKIVLVIGGNSGIGLASAQAFAAEGAEVAANGEGGAIIFNGAIGTGVELFVDGGCGEL